VEQFEHNPFLHNYETQVLLLTSLARCGTQNPDLSKQLQAGINQRQEKWSHLPQLFPQLQSIATAAPLTPPTTAETAGTLPFPAVVPTPSLPTLNIPGSIPAIPAPVADSWEKKLEDIDHLADSTDPQERKKAIEMLRALLEATPKEQPAYGALTEKLSNTCEQAVQQLRALAAKQFQDALPLAESPTRTEYLQAARKSLQQAMTYKEAKPKTLRRVEENLTIIEESLK
jgi:hypothetical protein